MRMRDLTFRSGDVTLAGTLALPDGAGPHPGVLMVAGSGPADRNNDTLFPPIRERLVAAGVAVFSYDKRGVGESSGSWEAVTWDDLIADAAAGVAALRDQPEVAADRVGAFGHSEGGWIVLRIAAGRDELAYVVTNSGPGMTPAMQDRHALAMALRDQGVEEPDVQACLALHDDSVTAGRRNASLDEVIIVFRAAPPYRFLARFLDDLDAPTWEFSKGKMDHNPIPDAARLRCPHLAVFGGADRLVPVTESAAAFAAAAGAPGRSDRSPLTVHIVPGADHRIRINEGSEFAPGYLDALARWIQAQ